MAKKTTTEKAGGSQIVALYDPQVLSAIAMKVKAEGFVPAADLKKEFGPEAFTRGVALIYRDLRMFKEVRRPWKDDQDVLGYEWANRPSFNMAERRKIAPELNFVFDLTQSLKVKYDDFAPVTVQCRFVTAALGGIPKKDSDDSPTNCFDRDVKGRLQILRYHQRAMITKALPMIGKEQAIARRIGFETIRLTANGNLSKIERPVNDNGQGKGFCRSECLADGTPFTINAMVPTSVLSIAEFLQALKLAGKFCGLSPGRSAGFGDFEVLSAE